MFGVARTRELTTFPKVLHGFDATRPNANVFLLHIKSNAGLNWPNWLKHALFTLGLRMAVTAAGRDTPIGN